MPAVPETGFLLIADLTGYTAYLAGGEIEHAPVIAGDLLETIVGRLEPPFRLAKFEGDAAFLHAEDGRADAPLLLDAIDAAYAAFRRRLRSIAQATSCDCEACGTAPRLDLKFFLHHGAYVRSPIAGHEELAGTSVIVVHRLLKGTTASGAHETDGRATGFAVVTEEAAQAIGLDADAQGLVRAIEEIEHIGTYPVYAIDLEARWQKEAAQRRVTFGETDMTVRVETVLPAPPATVWAYLTSPSLREAWEGAMVTEALGDVRGLGATRRCVTGLLSTLEEVVDWQPYEHVGYGITVDGVGRVEAAYDLASVDIGTAITARWRGVDTSGDVDAIRVAIAGLAAERRIGFERLRSVLEGATAATPLMVPAV